MSEYENLLAFLKPFAEGADGFIGFTKADRSQDPDDNKRWGAFVNWYGESGSGQVDLPFDVLSEDPKWEYYFTPAVLSEDSRLQSKFQHSNAIWIDFDEPVDWQRFTPAPSIVVQTSENKHHCYWLLEEPITNVNDMRYWCKRFLEYFSGGDESGFDATQLLKLPWGLNLKLKSRNMDGTPWAPKVVKFEPDLKYTELSFEHIPEPSVRVAEAVDLSALPDLPELDFGWQYYLEQFRHSIPQKILEKIRQVQEGGEEKRSGVLYHIICELFDVLDSPDDVFSILLGSPNDKFTADQGARGASLLWKDINRVSAKRDKDKSSPTLSSTVQEIMNGKSSHREKGIEVDAYVMGSLKELGTFIQSQLGECFYVDQRTGAAKLYSVNTESTGPFSGLIRRRFGLNAGVDRNILSGILHSAVNECQLKTKTTFHHFAHYDIQANLVYVDKYDGFMYVLNGEDIDLKQHGYNGVYFYQNENNEFPRPFDYDPEYTEGGLDALVLDGPNFTTQGHKISRKELRHLLKTWVAAFFFPTTMDTKPIVLVHGAADSGKTTLFQNLSVMFTGDSTFSVTEIPKDVKEFNVQVTQSSYIFYDNVEVNKPEMQVKLAQVATGFTVKMRKLFTTNEMVSVKARSFVGITSRTIDRIQDDVVQRYIIIPVHPFSANADTNSRRAMSNILKEVMDNRDALWSEMLDFVNKMVKQIGRHGLQQTGTKLRMADYGAMLDLTASMVGMSSAKMEEFILTLQAEIVSENDPIFTALIKLVEGTSYDPEAKYSPKTLHETLGRLHRRMLAQYGTPNKFGRALRGYISNGQLERYGIHVENIASGNNNYFTIVDARGAEHFE